MHISEGILSGQVLLAGAALAAAGTAIGLKKMDYDRIPQVAILSAGFFVGSLVHVPIGPVSAHLVLNGILGIFLGWAAFPAILVGLLLQAVLFQYGGFTALGINVFNMALPAVLCFILFRSGVRSSSSMWSSAASFMTGFGAVFLSSIMVALSLYITGGHFLNVARLIVAGSFPVMVIEGLISLFCIRFVKKVKPEILEVVYASRN